MKRFLSVLLAVLLLINSVLMTNVIQAEEEPGLPGEDINEVSEVFENEEPSEDVFQEVVQEAFSAKFPLFANHRCFIDDEKRIFGFIFASCHNNAPVGEVSIVQRTNTDGISGCNQAILFTVIENHGEFCIQKIEHPGSEFLI